MNSKQLKQLIDFVKPYYVAEKAGQFHDWRHIKMVRDAAIFLAQDVIDIDLILLEASCYIHDIGRVNDDENHPTESMKISKPFLIMIGASDKDISIIDDAVTNHGSEKICVAKTMEAKLLFDADKMQILSVYGFLRCWAWLVDERKMDMDQAMTFLWGYAQKTYREHIQTDRAREILMGEMKNVEKIVKQYSNWNGHAYCE